MKINKTIRGFLDTKRQPSYLKTGKTGKTGTLGSNLWKKLGTMGKKLVTNWESNLLSTGKELGKYLDSITIFFPSCFPVVSQYFSSVITFRLSQSVENMEMLLIKRRTYEAVL